jgi:tetratricopeptide (TPR) repeat protein
MDIEYNSQAQKYKELGNQHYKAKDYEKAINYYSRAIEVQEDPAFYSNRAICYFNLNRFEECIRDCNVALRVDPQFAKAYKKKYQACINLLKFDEAVEAAKAYAALEKNIAAKN